MSGSNQGAANRPVKATLCRYFAADGQCFFGESCQFVHAKPGRGSSQSGDKSVNSFTVLPSSASGSFKTDANKNVNSNTMVEHKALNNSFSALSLAGKEEVQTAENPQIPGNQAFEFLPTATNHVHQTESIGGTTYFYPDGQKSEPQSAIILPSYHGYPGAPSHLANLPAVGNSLGNSFSMSTQIRQKSIDNWIHYMITTDWADNLQCWQTSVTYTMQELLSQHAAMLMQLDPEISNVPREVDNYHTLFPLEPIDSIANQQSRRTFGCITSCYKAVSSKDALTYVLRRMHGIRLTNTKAMGIVDQWKKLEHSNLVHLREVFTTKAFDDNSLVFVYDYHPNAENVLHRHFMETTNSLPNMKNGTVGAHLPPPAGRKGFSASNSQSRQHLMPERLIWNYVIQLSSALRSIHSVMLACRVIDPSKILILSNSRLRINGCGIFDLLDTNNNSAMVQHYQQEDLVAFGKLILALSCYSLQAVQRESIQQSLEFVTLKYSNDLKNLILYLLTNPLPTHAKSINDIMPMIGARFYTQLDATQVRCDVLQGELAKEMENSRLFRILCKMGCINERPEFNMDPSWAETGDRYLIKLFRDHLFHQVTENGEPWIDMSHIVSSLNKLDSGSPEKICLISRDEQSVLVVSYGDLKACFDGAFNELFSLSI